MYRKALLTTALVLAMLVPPSFAQSESSRERADVVQIPSPGRVSLIGVRLEDVTGDTAAALKLPRAEGALVAAVNESSPAAAAGFRAKDVVVGFDGERVRSAAHLARLVQETPAGREVAVQVIRDGRRLDLRVAPEAGRSWFDPRFGGIDTGQLEDRIRRSMEDIGGRLGGDPGEGRLGVSVQPLQGDLAAYFGVKSGVLVASVGAESPAAKAGLKAGDVITAVDGRTIETPAGLVEALRSRGPQQEVEMTVVRDKKELKMTATLRGPNGARVRGRRV